MSAEIEKRPTHCLKCPKALAETTRQKLISNGLLESEIVVESDERFVYLPVSGRIDSDFEIVEREMVVSKRAATDYREIADVPERLKEHLPTSFDIVGDIAIIKLYEPELVSWAENIGLALLKALPSLKTVLLDKGVRGEYRVRDVSLLAGLERSRTRHREFGVTLCVDVAKAYFSPRLANEHRRVAGVVEDGEVVVDMFCGVGGFSLMIAKHARPEHVYGIDANPEAISLLEESIGLNRVLGIVPRCGDARTILEGLSAKPVDRIIMNHPHHAHEFLDVAFESVRPGGVVHYHAILAEDELEGRLEVVRAAAKAAKKAVDIQKPVVIRNYSAESRHLCFDLMVRDL